MSKKYWIILVLLIAFIVPVASHAVVIDFENVAPAQTTVGFFPNYTEDGYKLSNDPSTFGVYVFSQTLAGHPPGSDFFGWNNDPSGNPVVLTNLIGKNFDLISLDVATVDFGFPVSFDIIGNLAGGGTLTYNVVGANAFQNVVLNWIGLSSVEFHFVSGSLPAIDNLKVAVPVLVPAPATVILMGLGMVAGICSIRKRKLAA